MKSLIAITALTSVIGLALPQHAAAQAITSGAEGDGWRASIEAYSFLPISTTGTATVAGFSADVDLDLRDIFESLNFAAALRGELWKGDFGAIVDLYYVNVGGDVSASGEGPLGASARADITLRQGWVAVMGAYRFAHGTYGEEGRRFAFDAAAGVRFNILDQDVRVRASTDAGLTDGVDLSLGGQENFFEPALSLRGAVEVADGVTVGARGEIGGFGVSGDDLQWLVLAGVDWRAWPQTSLRFGWQAYGIDFLTQRSDGRFAYDVFQHGPYLGASYHF